MALFKLAQRVSPPGTMRLLAFRDYRSQNHASSSFFTSSSRSLHSPSAPVLLSARRSYWSQNLALTSFFTSSSELVSPPCTRAIISSPCLLVPESRLDLVLHFKLGACIPPLPPCYYQLAVATGPRISP
eukprot:scaffold3368_cov107-Isochrysis_galbana.AAC.1